MSSRESPGLCDNLLVGVAGSIHVLQIHSYLLLFQDDFAKQIRVIMTTSAQQMVDPRTVELITGTAVLSDSWDRTDGIARGAHIQLTRWADLFVVLPATANILGKAANGIADDLLSTAILSSPEPLIFAPAMNPIMWNNRVLQRNVQTLKQDGHYIVMPDSAISITSGQFDEGLSPSPETIMHHLRHVRMKRLRNEYWEEATRTKPTTPSEQLIQITTSSNRAGHEKAQT